MPSHAVLPVDRLWRPARGPAAVLRALVLAVAGSLLLWASAKIQVPFWPVPMTLQTAAVFLLGFVYGPRLALATVALYLAEGAAGLPVFAGTPEKGLGLAYVLGPTGGYLVGFLAAAWIAGRAAERGVGIVGALAAMLLGSLAIYGAGLAWLAGFVGAEAAVRLGLLPFLPGDLVKIGLVAAARELLRRPRPADACDGER